MTRTFYIRLISLLALLILPTLVQSATFVVNTGADSHDYIPGDGIAADDPDPQVSRVSLRAAIEEANALAGPDTVILNNDTLIVRVSLGPLVITGDSTYLRGTGNFPVIDGALAPMGTNLIEIRSNNNIIEGLTFKRSRYHGIKVTGDNNRVGGLTTAERNQFLGCGLDYSDAFALAIDGETAGHNRITANWFGLYGNGTKLYGNRNGILITNGAFRNRIGGALNRGPCFITGNDGWGIAVKDGASYNEIEGCVIGLDLTWINGPGNGAGGILIDGSGSNWIGGGDNLYRNIISGNHGPGISLRGPNCTSNRLTGNFVGVDTTGLISIANHGDGVRLSSGAHHNTIGDRDGLPANVLSGNFGDGLRITGLGTDRNLVIGNYIGPSFRGGGLYAGDTYNQNGVTITDGARFNTIGSSSPDGRNVISLNEIAGLSLTSPGTSDNRIVGNYIGISAWGISSAPNGTGVVIRDGASRNRIGGSLTGERNIISGNRAEVFPWGAGVVIYDTGTRENAVIGNYIGTSASGNRALRNGSSGVIIGNGAQYNSIGGVLSGSGNVISGNGAGLDVFTIARGVTITGTGTSYNTVEGNLIGPKANRSGYLSNWGHGVGIFSGASNNQIGGDSFEAGNLIAGNDGFGVLVDGPLTLENSIRNNIIGQNDSLDIGLQKGGNELVEPPVILTVSPEMITGYASKSYLTIDLYRYWEEPLTGSFEQNLIASTRSAYDGTFTMVSLGLTPGDSVRATATNFTGSSSQFSEKVQVATPTDLIDETEPLPYQFALKQNYPNPFNPSTSISFSLPKRLAVSLSIYNITGQLVAQPLNEVLSAGEHTVLWNGLSSDQTQLASGVYLYRLKAGEWTSSRTALLIR